MAKFKPETKLTRKQRKVLQREQFNKVQMAYKGSTPIIQDMGQFMENMENIKEKLLALFYDELPDLDTLDDDAFEELYKPIAELDPLNSKKFRSEPAD